MAEELKRKFSWTLIHRNKKTPFAELDLVFKDFVGTYHLVEVKAGFWSGDQLVGRRQQARLRRAHQFWQGSTRAPVRSHLAMVGDFGVVNLIEDFL